MWIRANTDLRTQGNPRTTVLLAIAKANNLKVDLVHTEPAKGISDDYRLLNRLGKVPTFQGSDGYVLTECMAIAIYRASTSLISLPMIMARDEESYNYPVIPV